MTYPNPVSDPRPACNLRPGLGRRDSFRQPLGGYWTMLLAAVQGMHVLWQRSQPIGAPCMLVTSRFLHHVWNDLPWPH